jgi:hypothetical protein
MLAQQHVCQERTPPRTSSGTPTGASERSSLVARLLISGPKSDSCSFMPWRGAAAATAGNRQGYAPKKLNARAFTQRIGAHEWEMPPQNLRNKRRKSHSASGRRRISAGARLGSEERSGFGAAQLRVEADTARRWPGGRAAWSTYKVGGRHAARNSHCASPSATRAIAGQASARRRRAASASARGPRPCSLTLAVRWTKTSIARATSCKESVAARSLALRHAKWWQFGTKIAHFSDR